MHTLLLYIEIEIICLVLLFFIYIKTKNNIGLNNEVVAFRRTVLATMLLPIINIICALGQNQILPLSPFGNSLLRAIYMVQIAVASLCWFIFNEEKLGHYRKLGLHIKRLVLIPVGFLLFLSFSSIKTGWLFYVDAQNVYHRGNYYVVQNIIAYLYIVTAVVHSLWRGLREKNHTKRGEAFVMAAFPILPSVGGFLQIVVDGLPTSWIATTISLLIVFVSFQEAQISRDALTGLNNRRKADEYLFNHITNKTKNQRGYFFLMDVNRFKQINDNFGHAEGDHALQLVAEMLRQVANKYKAFPARMGGDEFCLIWETDGLATPEALRDELHAHLDAICREHNLPYSLTISVGYEEYIEQDTNIVALMHKADQMLYEEKAFAHGRVNKKG